MERTTGTVKWFSRVKGYGFIQPDGRGHPQRTTSCKSGHIIHGNIVG